MMTTTEAEYMCMCISTPPYLSEVVAYQATKVMAGWLLKRGEHGKAAYRRRYCVLYSNYKLCYFESEAAKREKGTVDLSVAKAVQAGLTRIHRLSHGVSATAPQPALGAGVRSPP